MIECTEILNVVPNGTSSPPIIFNTDDGIYYVKYVENINGNKVLVNEYICYQLAELFNITIPRYGLVSMERFLGQNYRVHNEEIVFECNVAFGSKQVGENNPMIISSDRMTLRDSVNKCEFLRIIALDYFVDNRDRVFNYANLLYTPADKTTWVIDFTHVFSLDTIWDQYSCRQKMDIDYVEYGFEDDSIYTYMMESTKFAKEDIEEISEMFKCITAEKIRAIIDSVPSEWKCPQKDLDALYLYLIKRLSRFENILSIIERRLT